MQKADTEKLMALDDDIRKSRSSSTTTRRIRWRTTREASTREEVGVEEEDADDVKKREL